MTLTPPVRDDDADGLTKRFAETGHLVLPGLLPDDLLRRLLPEVDHWVDRGLRERSIASSLAPDRHGPPPLVELEMPAHAELLTFAPLLERIAAAPSSTTTCTASGRAPTPRASPGTTTASRTTGTTPTC